MMCAVTAGVSTGLLHKLFASLDTHDLRYCVLHSYDTLPEAVESDLDLALHPEDLGRLALVFRDLRQSGYRLVQTINYETGGYCYVVTWMGETAIHSLAIDVITEHREDHAVLMRGEELVWGRRRCGEFWIAWDAVEFQYLLAKKVFKGTVSRAQVERLRFLALALARKEGERITAFLFGEAWKSLALDACASGNVADVLPDLRRSFRRNLLRNRPVNLVSGRLAEARRLMRRWWKPTGLFVCVLGPDGCGKSTAIKGLTSQMPGVFSRHRVMHWRPKVLAPRGTGRPPLAQPHGNPLDSGMQSTVRLLVHVIDYIAGYWLQVRPLMVRSGLVIFDRYFYDLPVDPARYRFGGPRWLLEIARHLVPAPDLQIVLDAPESVVRARKQEQPLEEIRRQRAAYRRHAARQGVCALIDGSQTASSVAADAAGFVCRFMEARTRQRDPDRFAEDVIADGRNEPDALAGVLAHFRPRQSTGDGAGLDYCLLPSARAPRWLVPLERGRMPAHALDVYQPYKIKARVQKTVVSALLGARRTPLPKSWMRSARQLPFGLDDLVFEITGQRPHLTFLIGERGEYRKLTVQATASNGEILAYAKVPLTRGARGRVRREADMLARLAHATDLAPHIPEVLFANFWNGEFVLVQRPVTGHRAPSRYGGLHQEFLRKLWDLESNDRPGFEIVDEIRSSWSNIDGRISAGLRAQVDQALLVVREQFDNITVPCGLSHGDFVPFNMRQSPAGLSVFDWEAAETNAPIWWDIFHFDAQTRSLLGKPSGYSFDCFQHPAGRGAYLLYLIRSMCDALKECPNAPRGLAWREQALNKWLLT